MWLILFCVIKVQGVKYTDLLDQLWSGITVSLIPGVVHYVSILKGR